MHDAMGNSGASSGIQVSFIVALVDFQGCGMGVRGVAGVEEKHQAQRLAKSEHVPSANFFHGS